MLALAVGGVVGRGSKNGSLLLTQDADIWSLALEQGSDPAIDSCPLWTPDDDRVVFRSDLELPTRLFWKAADGRRSSASRH